MRVNAEIEQVLDEILDPACGGCGRSLAKPGTRCPSCGTFPDLTREEAARELTMPGELSLHRADVAGREAEALMFQFAEAARVPDRLRKLAELEAEAAEVQEALTEAVARREGAREALAAAEAAGPAVRKPLEACFGLARKAAARLEEVQRTCEGDEAEWKARIAIAELRPVLDRRQREFDEAAAVTASRRLDLEEAGLHVAMCEGARDEDAKARMYLGEVRPSAECMVLLARPLTELMAALIDDQQAEHPQCEAEWQNLKGLLYRLAGAAGLLDLAEDATLPRILSELTGPLSRAQDVAALERRLAGSRLALPPVGQRGFDDPARKLDPVKGRVQPDLFSRPAGWDTWADEQKAAHNAALKAHLARIKGREWERQARPLELDPSHPRHHLADENGFSCGCGAGDPEWRTWVFMAGRGAGKTWTGANWILSQAMAQPGTYWAVAAPTIGDVERTCFLGESGILNVAEPGDLPAGALNVNKTRLTLGNGSVIQGFSADTPERARGANLYGCWCDELALFKYQTDTGRALPFP